MTNRIVSNAIIFICVYFSIQNSFLIKIYAQNAATCLDKDIVQLSAPGIPAYPTKTEDYLILWLNPPPKFLTIQEDDSNYELFKKRMHNRIVRVFVSKSFIENQQSRIDLGNLVFDTWAIFWQEFGGFPFDKYTVVFDSNLYWSYSGFGTGMDASFTDHDHIAHEMFHAWNANAIRPNEDEAFWFLEGVAMCFNTRMANSTYHYSDALNYYKNYRANYGDKPLSTISINSDPDIFGFASMKGFLVGFLLDLTLSQKGHHLGEIHNELYHRYGTKPSDSYAFTNEDILDAVNEVTGEDFSGFFNDYVYGTRALPLSYNSYEYICHGNPHLLSFGLPTPFIPILLLND